MPNAHMPVKKKEVAEVGFDSESEPTSKRKRKLEERDGCSTARAKTVVHDFDIRLTTTQFCIYYNETNGPICNRAENHEKNDTCEETSLTDSIRKSYMISIQDCIC